MYVLLAVILFAFQHVTSQLRVPVWYSNVDFQQMFLYKLIKVEEEVKEFRKYVDDAKVRQKQTEEDQSNKLENALDIFRNSTEQQMIGLSESSETVLQEMRNSVNDLQATLATLKNGTMIGFTVTAPIDSPTSGQITFSTVVTNEGESYDTTTGVFVCRVPGLYYFSVSLEKSSFYQGSTHCYIWRNSSKLVRAYTVPGHTPKLGYYAAVNNVFVRLETGDRVRLASCSSALSMDVDSSFSGFLIRAD